MVYNVLIGVFVTEKIIKLRKDEVFITLGSLLKIGGVIDTGGQAKHFLSENPVLVNGEPDNRRGRKLYRGDKVRVLNLFFFNLLNMLIKKSQLKNFRNHTFLSFDFSSRLNALSGPNAIGKTNVAEAIYYLSLGHSFRTDEDVSLIQKNTDRAEIEATITEGELTRKIKVVITKLGRMITINGKNISKLSDLASVSM